MFEKFNIKKKIFSINYWIKVSILTFLYLTYYITIITFLFNSFEDIQDELFYFFPILGTIERSNLYYYFSKKEFSAGRKALFSLFYLVNLRFRHNPISEFIRNNFLNLIPYFLRYHLVLLGMFQTSFLVLLAWYKALFPEELPFYIQIVLFEIILLIYTYMHFYAYMFVLLDKFPYFTVFSKSAKLWIE